MRMRYGLFIFSGLLLLAMIFFLWHRPTVSDFCSGFRKCELSRIEFRGQGRHVTLSDPAALAYLGSLPRLEALPQAVKMTNGLSYEATLFDGWGSIGTVQVAVSTDEKVLSLVYFKSLLYREGFAFLIMDSNAPPKLREAIGFLIESGPKTQMNDKAAES